MLKIKLLSGFVLLSLFCSAQLMVEHIDFTMEEWKTVGSASVKQELSETVTSVSGGIGLAYLKGFEFENGSIECELYSPTDRAFLGLAFRIGNLENFECIYFQPHTSGKWDAIQYDPIFNSSPTWQLHNGKHFQAKATVPTQKWFHVKIDVLDNIAKVYIDHSKTCALSVNLQHKTSGGSIGVYSYHPAKFRNLSVSRTYNHSDSHKKEAVAYEKQFLSKWMISEPYDNFSNNMSVEAAQKRVKKWHQITAEANHLINLNRHFTKTPQSNTVLAKVFLHSKTNQSKQLSFGFSDKIRISLNAESVFEGDNSYRASDTYEDRGYVLSNHKSVDLQLKKGINELLFEVSEDKFGWGFIARLNNLEGITVKTVSE